MDISTPEKDNEIAQKLTMLLQTNVANMNPEIQHKMYKKLAMLWKMPDLAHDLGEYKAPQPDQSEEQMRALQLENLRLENIKLKKSIEDLDSKISERIAIAIDKEADRLTKAAQASYFDGRANQANAMADSINQNFIHKQNGIDLQNKITLNEQQNQANFRSQAAAAEHKRLSDLDKMAFQHHLNQASDRDNHIRTKDAMAFQNKLNNESDQQDDATAPDDMSSAEDANQIQTQQGE
jgi:hypothetical protein